MGRENITATKGIPCVGAHNKAATSCMTKSFAPTFRSIQNTPGVLSTYIARSAPPQPPEASRWTHYTGWFGSGTSPSSPWIRLQSAGRRRSFPSACCRLAWAPPYLLVTTGWWAWASLKQGTPAPLCHPHGPPAGTCPGGLSGWEELRKRKTKEGLIWGSRKSADGVNGNVRLDGEKWRIKVWKGKRMSFSSCNGNEAESQQQTANMKKKNHGG